jgi:hypothetical protein
VCGPRQTPSDGSVPCTMSSSTSVALDHDGKIDRLAHECQLSGVQTRDVEQIVDEAGRGVPAGAR